LLAAGITRERGIGGEGAIVRRRTRPAAGRRAFRSELRHARPPTARRLSAAALILFVSDLHIGRGTPAESRAAEEDFRALVDAHRGELATGALVLVGDVFDQFIEYRHLVPKHAIRTLALLGDLADAGCAVTYVAGNRDPWHVDLLERRLGVRLVRDWITEETPGGRTYIAHGDGLVPAERTYNRLRPILRSPLMARLYRMGLPGDSAFAFARWFAHRMESDGAPEPAVTASLRRKAAELLGTGAADLVVMGHGHSAECTPMSGGIYLNPGYWFADRTFACVDASGAGVYRWRDGRAEPLAPAAS
jgi:UDP-2,3-diacylglucosamine hydrolase